MAKLRYILHNKVLQSPENTTSQVSLISFGHSQIKQSYVESVSYYESAIQYTDAHLSKSSSGRKQKCTQFLTLFSGTAFHALSHGVIHFVRSVIALKTLKWKCLIGC